MVGTDHLRARLAAEELHAPSLLDYEIVSALRGLTLAGHLSAARAQDLLGDFRLARTGGHSVRIEVH